MQEGVEVGLEGNLLTITPRSAGTHIVTLQVSDGEDAIQYAYRIKVIPDMAGILVGGCTYSYSRHICFVEDFT